MKTLITLASLTASPAFAHTGGALHVPHAAYLVAVGICAVSLAAYRFAKR